MHRVEKIRRRLKAVREQSQDSPQGRLTHGGRYSLPDGTELVAAVAPGGRYFLYHPLIWAGKAWIVNMPVSFVIDEAGRVLTRTGQPTGWRIEDLADEERAVGRRTTNGTGS